MIRSYILGAALLIVLAVSANAQATTWQIGDKHTIRFDAGGEAGGIFKTLKGSIAFDGQSVQTAAFDLSIEVASVNTGNGLMNTHLKSAEWLDAGKYPVVRFTSKKVTASGSGFVVTGDLEMHGVKKEVSFPFSFQAKGNSGTFSARITVYRNDFHIGKPGGEVNDVIKIDLTVPVTKK